MLTAARNLSLVVRAGTGINSIDIEAASRLSILVAECPGKNAAAIAELTFALILALDRRLVENVNDLRKGVWNKQEYSQARGLKGRTLGIVGLGRVGEAVARRAKAFEMGVVAWSRSLTYERAGRIGVACCESPADVASRCDVLTVHLASVPETEKIIDRDILSRLKPGSYVINTARPGLLDYDALAAAVAERGLRAGLDVYPGEPTAAGGRFADTIMAAGGVVYGTHHIGGSTDQAEMAIAEEMVRIVKQFMRTGRVLNCMNLCAKSPAKYVLIVRHRNQPGVLAHTLNAISHAGVNVEEMENVICEGGESGRAQIKLDGPLRDDVLAEIRDGHEHVLAVSHAPLKEL
jgi:D-3-phosphoglycerate dehydrogenase